MKNLIIKLVGVTVGDAQENIKKLGVGMLALLPW